MPFDIEAAIPLEIVRHVFHYIPRSILYQKLILPYQLQRFNIYQLMVLEIIGTLFVIRNGQTSEVYDPLVHFYGRDKLRDILLIDDFEAGYQLVKLMLMQGLTIDRPILKLVVIYFHFRSEDPEPWLRYQIRYLLKILELLSFDSHYNLQVGISLQLIFDTAWPKTLDNDMFKIRERVDGITHKLKKLLVQKRHNNILNFQPPLLRLNKLDIIDELRLYNDQISDKVLRSLAYLSTSDHLQTLDLTANSISRIDYLPQPPHLKKLILNANGITTLNTVSNGDNYINQHTENQVNLKHPTHLNNYHNLTWLEICVNGLTSLKNVQLPPNLQVLKLAYNRISSIDFELPNRLEELDLSSNLLSKIDHVILPSSLRTLALSNNQFEEFPFNFFIQGKKLTKLLLDNNNISDLDDLGQLPDSLSHLVLDANEINYANISNILKPNLKYLSMSATGLMTLENINFPNSLEKLILIHNYIVKISHVNFGSNLKTLDLSSNMLTSFKFIDDDIKLSHNLHKLSLEANGFKTLYDFDLPKGLKELNVGGLDLDTFQGQDIENFPKTIECLQIPYLMVNHSSVEKIDLNLTDFKYLKKFLFTSPDVKHLNLKHLPNLNFKVECDCDYDRKFQE